MIHHFLDPGTRNSLSLWWKECWGSGSPCPRAGLPCSGTEGSGSHTCQSQVFQEFLPSVAFHVVKIDPSAVSFFPQSLSTLRQVVWQSWGAGHHCPHFLVREGGCRGRPRASCREPGPWRQLSFLGSVRSVGRRVAPLQAGQPPPQACFPSDFQDPFQLCGSETQRPRGQGGGCWACAESSGGRFREMRLGGQCRAQP